ncbi:MAG: hypothetical protein AB7P76_03750 [Candidatus Melainabacteria bacterium]
MTPFRKRTRASVNPFQVSDPAIGLGGATFVAGPAARSNPVPARPFAVREPAEPLPVLPEKPRSFWRRVSDWVMTHCFETVDVPGDRPVGMSGLLFTGDAGTAPVSPAGSAVRAAMAPRFGRTYGQPGHHPQAGAAQELY